MRRVAITGIGIVSSIGNNVNEVSNALRAGKSGIRTAPAQVEHKFRSQIAGEPTIDTTGLVDKRVRRFMGTGTIWNHIALTEALGDSGLGEDDISNPMTGIIMGSGGPSVEAIIEGVDKVRAGGPKRAGPFAVPKTMSSTHSATLATPFHIKGVNYSISSACATSAHCVGNAAELIQWGKQDIMLAGGGEELYWGLSVMFDAMGAMSSNFNDTPTRASRAYDADRDGFVIAGGAGVMILEEMEHAKARGATIHAEIVGYGATSDGYDMVQPSGEGAVRCMQQAIKTLDCPVDYLNPHATSTPIGDRREIEALREVFGGDCPPISATKSLTGHSLGGAGVQEAIYALLMMKGDFIAASANIDKLDPDFADMPIVQELRENVKLNCVLSNSFGFGGTNGSLALKRV
ncbi:MAG: beta-ketoacyl-ACP synthase I [Alphaproteobacteria bacterium]|nr:beta-ketoacyl-ACP synthase I [Alphaproteobacteria bacterium]